jgi:hypothetical protein
MIDIIYIYVIIYIICIQINIYIYYMYVELPRSHDLTSKVEVTAASASAAPPWYRQRHGAPGRGEHVGDFTGIGWIFQENMVKK